MQDDTKSSFAQLTSTTPAPSAKSEDTSITPPEAWGGERLSDKFAHLRQPLNLPSRFGMFTSSGPTSGSMSSGLHDTSLGQTSLSSLTSNLSLENLRTKDRFPNTDTSSLVFSEHLPSSLTSLSIGARGIPPVGDSPRTSSLAVARRTSSYAERISTTSAFSDGTSPLVVGSPKTKKTGAETKEELLQSLLSRSDASAAAESVGPLIINVSISVHFEVVAYVII